MKKEISLNEKEIKDILKEYFKLTEEPTLYFYGGWLNPPKITMTYYEKDVPVK